MKFVYVWNKIFILSRRVLVSINIVDKLLSKSQIFGINTHKKCYHVDILAGVIFWLLTSNVKAQRNLFLFLTNWIAQILSPPMAIVWSAPYLALILLLLDSSCSFWTLLTKGNLHSITWVDPSYTTLALQ
jgi:hypothetical protein